MNLDHIDQYLTLATDKLLEWLNYRIWLIEDWWHAGMYGPPTLWYNLQTYLDPPPPPGSAGPDIDIVAFAMNYMTKKQIHREAWYHYRKTKWIVRPESMTYALNRMKTKKDKKYMSMLLQLEELVLDNYKALLAEVEVRRVHTDEELTQARSDPVIKAQIRQTYDAYFDSLEFMTHPQTHLKLDWPEKQTRSQKLESQVKHALDKHPDYSSADKLRNILWLLRDRDFCIFSYSNEFQFLQFTREGRNLVLDFPYSIKWPSRYYQVDRVGLILKSHGFGPNLSLWSKYVKDEEFMLMQDTCNDKHAVLQAYFGFDHESFAVEIVQEIAKRIWDVSPDLSPHVTLGSWKE